MNRQDMSNEYALGSDDAEHERLIRQAGWLVAPTEDLLRRAGVSAGQRVLDLGSGVGDVSLIAAQLVGSKGEVVGAERDPRAVAKATARVAALGLQQVRFAQIDVAALPLEQPFDAVVGRYILTFLRDPAAVLRSVWRLVQPGGAVAFLEPWSEPFLAASQTLPLWRASANLVFETFHRTGANTSMGAELPAAFKEAGLPEPETHTYTLLDAGRWLPDVVETLAPQAESFGLAVAQLGELRTLYERLLAEAALHRAPVPLRAIVGAWARKPLTSHSPSPYSRSSSAPYP
jgi:ubiquinone/menaquinone biosynthesis C-methylase UbiE